MSLTTNRFRLQGRVRFQTVGPEGRIFSDTGWRKNLLLNQGMDAITDRVIADNFTHCCLGAGTTPTIVDSGMTTAVQNNITITLSGGAHTFTDTETDRGKMIKWDTGETAMIRTVLTPTTATAYNSASVSTGEFAVYQTTQTGLTNEIKRTDTCHTMGGGCGTTLGPPNTVVMRRTFEFPKEVGAGSTYREVGLSHTAASGNNLFARILLDDPITVLSGMNPRVAYELQITLYPGTPIPFTAAVSGWPVSPAPNTNAYQNNEAWGIAGVDDEGLTVPLQSVSGVDLLANEPSATCDILIGSNTTALVSPGDPVPNRWAASSVEGPANNLIYTPRSFRRVRQYTIGPYEGLMNDLRVISLGHIVSAGSHFAPVTTVLFDNAQTKGSLYVLYLEYQLNWSRVI